jgi:hypothetical protein
LNYNEDNPRRTEDRNGFTTKEIALHLWKELDAVKKTVNLNRIQISVTMVFIGLMNYDKLGVLGKSIAGIFY